MAKGTFVQRISDLEVIDRHTVFSEGKTGKVLVLP